MRTLSAAVTAAVLIAAPAAAQELEPRAYSPSPAGTTFLVVSGTVSRGGVFTEPSAALTDVEADVGIVGLAVGHAFGLLGKSMLVLGVVPVTWGEARGQIGEDRRQASRRGLADPRVKISTILSGSRPMAPAEFARAPRRPIVGASLTLAPPVGQYDPARLVNLGANRWSLKPELGFSLPRSRWTFDTYLGVWFFTENDAYYPGTAHRRQDPIVSLQGHVSYTFGRRAWVAGNATWYGGGRFTVDGVDRGGPYKNTRLGATLALPVGARQSLKFAYSAGAATRAGTDFKTLTAAWQVVFF